MKSPILFSVSRTVAALSIATVAFTAPAVAQPQQDWSQTASAAAKEGKVSLYTSMLPIQVERMSAAFKEAFPKIELLVNRNTENILTQKIIQEQTVKAEGADVVIVTNTDFADNQISAGNVVKAIGPNVIPFNNTKFVYKDYVPVVASYYVVLAYNTDQVKNAPTTYKELIDPSNKLVLGSTAIESGSGAALFYDTLRKDLPGSWDALAKKQVKIYPGAVPLSQALASGEVDAILYGVPPALSPLIKQGAPIKMEKARDVGAVGGVFAAQVLKNARHPAAAQLLVDFLMSAKGQEALNGDGLGMANSADVPGSLPPADIILIDTSVYSTDRVKEINAEFHRSVQNK